MKFAPHYASLLPIVGVSHDEVAAILGAESFSLEQIANGRSELIRMAGALTPGIASFALGSLGRLEAGAPSDLDFTFFFDSSQVSVERSELHRRKCVEVLSRSFYVPEKTFRSSVDIRQLMRNVGGEMDSNLNLTYRSLLLTEGVWLHNSVAAKSIKQAVFSIYSRAAVSRGRFLNSLGNDLHRYYRTLCVDYRFKVDEQEKSWAVRILKLRHSRKLWHLANLALQCWSVDVARQASPNDDPFDASSNDIQDEILANRLDWPPLVRVTLAMEHFGQVEICRDLYLAFNRFLSSMGSVAVREELNGLEYAERYDSAIYIALRENAEFMDRACGRIVEALWRACGSYFVRFCVL